MSAAAILKLQAVGFTAERVTAIADLIDVWSATKVDVEGAEHRLGTNLTEFRTTARSDLDAAEHRLDLKMEGVDRRLDLKITALQAEMVLLKWMMGFVLAFQVAIFAKLFLVSYLMK